LSIENKNMDIKKGEFLVRLARRAIESHLKGEGISVKTDDEELNERRGVFVTLNTYPEHELRGCIGFPEPILPLIQATVKSAISAATQDPRFPPVKLEELENIVVEVSVLTKPELIIVKNPREYLGKIEIGKHGLIVEKGFRRGLLLPQVPVEQGWDKEEFLCYTCMKAGLPPDCWFDEGTRLYRFSAEIFKEEIPKGRIVKA